MLKTIRRYALLVALFVAFGIAFTWLSLVSPEQRPVLAQSNLSQAQITVLILAVVFPYIGIWLTGVVGYIRLSMYARLIRGSKDGNDIKGLAAGILGVLLSLPLQSLFNTTSQVVATDDAGLGMLIRRVGTYVVIGLLLLSLHTLMKHTRVMASGARRRYVSLPWFGVVTFLVLGEVYVYFVLTNPLFENGQVSGHLAPWVVINTIVLPRLLAWYWGLHAVWNLYQYARQVPGKLYRLAFNYLAVGLGVVTLTIILLQYLQAMSAVTKLPIAGILVVVYCFLIVASAGFLLIARGGKELTKIEEV